MKPRGYKNKYIREQNKITNKKPFSLLLWLPFTWFHSNCENRTAIGMWMCLFFTFSVCIRDCRHFIICARPGGMECENKLSAWFTIVSVSIPKQMWILFIFFFLLLFMWFQIVQLNLSHSHNARRRLKLRECIANSFTIFSCIQPTLLLFPFFIFHFYLLHSNVVFYTYICLHSYTYNVYFYLYICEGRVQLNFTWGT